MSKLNSLFNIMFGFFVRVIGAATSFFSILVLTNELSKNDSSSYFIFISLSLFMSVLFRLGADNLLIKKTIQDSDNSRIDLSLTVSIVLFIIILSFILNMLGFLFLKDSLFWLLTILLSAFMAINIVIGCVFNALNRITLSVFLTLALPSMLTLIGFLFIKVFDMLIINSVYMIVLLSNILSLSLSLSLLFFLILRKKLRLSVFLISPVGLINMSKNFFGGSVVLALYNQLPFFVLGAFSTGNEVALFGVSSRFSSVLGYINSISSKYIALIYSKSKVVKNETRGISSAIKFITVLQICFLILFMFFSEEILSVFGEGYEDAKITIFFLLLVQVLNLFFQNFITNLQVTGKEYKALLFLSFNLFLLFLLFSCFYILFSLNSLSAAISMFVVLFLSCSIIAMRKVL